MLESSCSNDSSQVVDLEEAAATGGSSNNSSGSTNDNCSVVDMEQAQVAVVSGPGVSAEEAAAAPISLVSSDLKNKSSATSNSMTPSSSSPPSSPSPTKQNMVSSPSSPSSPSSSLPSPPSRDEQHQQKEQELDQLEQQQQQQQQETMIQKKKTMTPYEHHQQMMKKGKPFDWNEASTTFAAARTREPSIKFATKNDYSSPTNSPISRNSSRPSLLPMASSMRGVPKYSSTATNRISNLAFNEDDIKRASLEFGYDDCEEIAARKKKNPRQQQQQQQQPSSPHKKMASTRRGSSRTSFAMSRSSSRRGVSSLMTGMPSSVLQSPRGRASIIFDPQDLRNIEFDIDEADSDSSDSDELEMENDAVAAADDEKFHRALEQVLKDRMNGKRLEMENDDDDDDDAAAAGDEDEKFHRALERVLKDRMNGRRPSRILESIEVPVLSQRKGALEQVLKDRMNGKRPSRILESIEVPVLSQRKGGPSKLVRRASIFFDPEDLRDTSMNYDSNRNEDDNGVIHEQRPEQAVASKDRERDALNQKGCVFHAFTGVVQFAQGTWVQRLTTALIYVSFFGKIVAFCYITAVQHQDNVHIPPAIQLVNILIAVATGILTVPVLLTGWPVLRASGILMPVVTDCIFWAGSVFVSVLSFGFDDYSGMGERAMLALAALVSGIRLNTNKVFNDAVDTIVIQKNDKNKSFLGSTHIRRRSIISAPITKVLKVIKDSKVPQKYKATLLKHVDAVSEASAEDSKLMGQIDFLDFLHRTVPLLQKWKMRSGHFKELQHLQSQLSFQSFTKDDALVIIEEDENISGSTLLSTVALATKQMFISQPLLCIVTIIGWTIGCAGKPAMSFVTGVLVNVAEDVARTGDPESQQKLINGLVGLLVLFVANELLFYLTSMMTARVVSNAAARVRCDFVQAVLYSGNQFEASYHPGALINVFNSGVAKFEQLLDFLLFDLVDSIASLVSALVFLAVVDYSFALYVMAVVTLLLSLNHIENRAIQASEKSEQSNAHLLSRFQNLIAIRKAAKVGNCRDYLYDRIRNPAIMNSKRDDFVSGCWGNLLFSLYSTGAYSLNVSAMILFLVALANGQITAGEFFSLVAFVSGAIDPIEAIGRFSGLIANMSGAVFMIQKILDDAKADDERVGRNDMAEASKPISLDRELVFDDVYFAHTPESDWVLKGVSTTIPAGSYVSIVGTSGSGKSTMLGLLKGTHQCSSGSIYLDGTDISSIPLHSLRDSLAVVFQETFVLDGTIRENIAFGSTHASEEDIMNAAKDAGVHDSIMMLPQQYDTVIGKETTMNMSGGQLQRICGIARALARKPKLLLLDECTSALDSVTERLIFDALERRRDKGMTVISVTHRSSTALNADMILVLDKGVIAETGTFEELVQGRRGSGIFASFVMAGAPSMSFSHSPSFCSSENATTVHDVDIPSDDEKSVVI